MASNPNFQSLIGACALTLAVAIVSVDAQAAIRRVDKDSTAPTPNGLMWDTAFPTLQAALAVSGDEDEIWVADGTYKPGTTRTASFVMSSEDIRIYGGFQGISHPDGPETEDTIHDRNPFANATVLSGDIGFIGNPADNCFHVVTVSGTGISSKIDGFTIRDGNADAATGVDSEGGAMRVVDSSIRIVRCRFEFNRATKHGAGLFLNGSGMGGQPEVIASTFRNNGTSTTVRGGGLFSGNNFGRVVNCLFHDNIAQEGGAIVALDTGVTFVNSTIAYNTAVATGLDAGGGGIFIYGSHEDVITNCILWGNTDQSPSSIEGAQIFEYLPPQTSDPEVTYSIIQDCSAFCASPPDNNGGSNPLFVSVTSDNYRVQSSSPAINSGFNDNIPPDNGDLDQNGEMGDDTPVDIVLKSRIITTTVDRGAYEFRACPADLTGDGTVGSADLAQLLVAWGNPGCASAIPCHADLTDDSKVDSADNDALLAQWGPCPGGEGFGGPQGDGLTLEEVLVYLGFSSAQEFVEWTATADDADLAVVIAQLAALDG